MFGLQQQVTQVNLELLEKAMTPYPSLEFMAPDLVQMLGNMLILYLLGSKLEGLWGPVTLLLLFLTGGAIDLFHKSTLRSSSRL